MAEFNVLLEQCLRRNVAGFESLTSVDRLSGGASLESYRLTIVTNATSQQLCLRRTHGGKPLKRVPGRPGLAAEAKLMQCAKAVGVAEPDIIHVLTPEDELGQGFFMEWLDGIAIGSQVLRAPELDDIRPQFARECGEALGRIHKIDLDATGLRADLDVFDAAKLIEQFWKNYRRLDTQQPMIDYVARWLIENAPEDVEPALVHNDFRNGNIMFSPRGIVAVLDWEYAYVGDPMRDLGWMCTNSWRFGRTDLPVGGFGSYEEFFAGYEAVSGIKVDPARVHYWQVFGSFSWAIGCLGMADHYRNGPDKSVERPGIGRRSSECQVDCANLLIPGPVELIKPPAAQDKNMPRTDELLASVTDFLRNDVMANTKGRTKYLARVAGNSLDIVLRESQLGEAARHHELARLQSLFGCEDDLEALRQRLVDALRDGSMALDTPGLAEHLRHTTVNQLAIDQPKYSGLANALGYTPDDE